MQTACFRLSNMTRALVNAHLLKLISFRTRGLSHWLHEQSSYKLGSDRDVRDWYRFILDVQQWVLVLLWSTRTCKCSCKPAPCFSFRYRKRAMANAVRLFILPQIRNFQLCLFYFPSSVCPQSNENSIIKKLIITFHCFHSYKCHKWSMYAPNSRSWKSLYAL